MSHIFQGKQAGRASRLQATKWKDCGGKAGGVTSLSLTDPLAFPGNLSVNVAGSLNMTLKSPLKVSMAGLYCIRIEISDGPFARGIQIYKWANGFTSEVNLFGE